MSLSDQLSEVKASFVKNVPEDTQAVMANATQELARSNIMDALPKVGSQLKAFELPNQKGEKRSLSSLLADGPLVITFYRGGWCPYCNIELRAYQERLSEIKQAGATLVAITPELPDASLSTIEKNTLDFEVLSDVNSDYSRDLGITFSLPEELRPIYESFGIQVEQHNGSGQFDLPLPATLVVASNGEILSVDADVDYTKRQEPADVLKALESISTAA